MMRKFKQFRMIGSGGAGADVRRLLMVMYAVRLLNCLQFVQERTTDTCRL